MKELGYLLLIFLLMGYLSRFSRLPSIRSRKLVFAILFSTAKKLSRDTFYKFFISSIFSPISFVKSSVSGAGNTNND